MSEDRQERFGGYVEALAEVIGHADRAAPLRDYCLGLFLPGDRKSVEPIAAPARVSAKHQSLLHFIAHAPWSDERVLGRIRELTVPIIEGSGAIEAWIAMGSVRKRTGDRRRGSHRHQRSEPDVRPRAPGVRPHRMTRNTVPKTCNVARSMASPEAGSVANASRITFRRRSGQLRPGGMGGSSSESHSVPHPAVSAACSASSFLLGFASAARTCTYGAAAIAIRSRRAGSASGSFITASM